MIAWLLRILGIATAKPARRSGGSADALGAHDPEDPREEWEYGEEDEEEWEWDEDNEEEEEDEDEWDD